jgi:hypothetical protein
MTGNRFTRFAPAVKLILGQASLCVARTSCRTSWRRASPTRQDRGQLLGNGHLIRFAIELRKRSSDATCSSVPLDSGRGQPYNGVRDGQTQ